MLLDNNELNLATLPPDIIHQLVRCESPSTNKMRLISRSWNSVVLEFLSNRRNLPTLERAVLCAGLFKENSKSQPAINQLRMYTLFPEKYLDRFGEGLIVPHGSTKLDDTVEVCNPLRPMRMEDKISMLDVIVATLTSIAHLLDDSFLYFIYACGMYIIYKISINFLYEKNLESLCENEIRPKFIRFFESFSRVETAVLVNLKDRLLNNIENILGDIRIDQLEIRRTSFDNATGERILGMCRKNVVRMVLISICKFTDDFEFDKFVVELTQLDVQLDLYDTECCNTQLLFGQDGHWWDKMDSKLTELGISIRSRIIYNGVIPNSKNDYFVRTHIQYTRKNDEKDIEPLKSVHKSRGLYSYQCDLI